MAYIWLKAGVNIGGISKAARERKRKKYRKIHLSKAKIMCHEERGKQTWRRGENKARRLAG
jgi:hypothetical protein